MNNLKVLNGGKSDSSVITPKVDKVELYKNAFVNAMLKSTETTIKEDRDRLKQIAYYAVKHVAEKERKAIDLTWEQAQAEFSFICVTKDILQMLTLQECINAFPIPKEYDGEKYQCKDYYYAVKEFAKYNNNEPLGKDNLEHILWDSMNLDLFRFQAYTFSIISTLRQFQGKRGIMEEFMDEQGIESYTINESGGKKYMQSNKTGKFTPVKPAKKRAPKHLKVM